jgi:RimJ/RimL family protein N-acetyltransferase
MKKTTRPIFPVPALPMTTARLLMRPIQQSDLEDFHILRTQIEVMKWTSTGKVDVDREATQIWMNRSLPPNDATTFNFAIEELSRPGTVIGVLGCHISEPPECGYMFRTEYWGMGYATEAFKRWLQAWWELPTKDMAIEDANSASDTNDYVVYVPEVLKAVIDEKNVASARILANAGFRPVSRETIEHNGATVNEITLELQRPGC